MVVCLFSMQSIFAAHDEKSMKALQKIRTKMNTEPKYTHITRKMKSGDSFKTRLKWLVNLMEDITYIGASAEKQKIVSEIKAMHETFKTNAQVFFTDNTGRINDRNVKKAQRKLTGRAMKNAEDKDFHTKFAKDLDRLFKREGTADTHSKEKQLATIIILSRIMPDFKHPQATFPAGAPLQQYKIINKKKVELEISLNQNEKGFWEEMYRNFLAK